MTMKEDDALAQEVLDTSKEVSDNLEQSSSFYSTSSDSGEVESVSATQSLTEKTPVESDSAETQASTESQTSTEPNSSELTSDEVSAPVEPLTPTEPIESKLAASARTRNEISFIPTFCVRKSGLECNKCELICPHEAISFNEESICTIDSEKCSRCGICVGVCDSFASHRITYEDLIERINRVAHQFGELFVTCTDHIFPGFEPQENVLVLPCLAAFPPEAYTYALSVGVPVHVYYDEAYCENCAATNSSGKRLYDYVSAVAQEWSGTRIQLVDEIPETGNLLGKIVHTSSDYDRRALFTNSAKEAATIASGDYRTRNERSTNEFAENRELMRAAGYIRLEGKVGLPILPTGTPHTLKVPRLTMLIESLKNRPEMASLITHYYLETDEELCNGCGACVKACPMAARTLSEETNTAVTNHLHCSACDVCIEACPNEACFYSEDDAERLIPKEETW
ncbi:MAG: 4Fe-4S binding protein [Anaerotardibacter sp.]